MLHNEIKKKNIFILGIYEDAFFLSMIIAHSLVWNLGYMEFKSIKKTIKRE